MTLGQISALLESSRKAFFFLIKHYWCTRLWVADFDNNGRQMFEFNLSIDFCFVGHRSLNQPSKLLRQVTFTDLISWISSSLVSQWRPLLGWTIGYSLLLLQERLSNVDNAVLTWRHVQYLKYLIWILTRLLKVHQA